MSHPEQIRFFNQTKKIFPHFFNNVNVIEIGSLDINGSIREIFNALSYIGVDLDEGPGVDLIAEGQNLDFEDNFFNVAVSSECFEHNPYWLETFLNMCRMASDFVIFSCASTGRREHGTTRTTPKDSPFTLKWDYYKNLTQQDFESRIDLTEIFSNYQFEYNDKSCDLYFWGVKK